MEKVKLLDKISLESLNRMIPCFKPVVRRFGKGETIMTYHDGAPSHVAVLLKGRALLEVFNSEGDGFLLESYEEGEVFGELFTLPLHAQTYMVRAQEPSQVVFIDYQHIITPCEESCAHHTQLISNLFLMTAQRSQELSLHLSLLNQPSTREKLLAYLRFARARAGAEGREPFTLPLTLSQLAEYLRVNRSAMSRELKAMAEEGLIQMNKKEFVLL